MTNHKGVEIVVGSWIVYGQGQDDRDAGEVMEMHEDGTASVAWEGGACLIRDAIHTESDVYTSRRAALVAAFGEDAVARHYGI